ncbi:MAG: alpha-ketoacid dehydrogenase subunit beta [Rhizobiales bacterium]|nr:alpha-ketoacid dehydrogenase subunit beta [Hyphomicrobiales bacterium]NRB13213.1 alpha-ketoacid dehydrogenase subunit beta [Hyphomicrobiales bacterium]
MAQMNMLEAILSAQKTMLARDDKVVILGQDIGYFGGVFRATEGLQAEFGSNRVFDTPISENGIVAAAIGMSLNGLRPIAEIQFADYIYPAFDQIASEAAKLRYRSGGEYSTNLTIRTPCGGGIRGGQTHSQSPEGIFTHVTGIHVIMPSNPYDAKGLLISAIQSNDPVIFFEPKRLYNGPFYGEPDKPSVGWDSHEKGEVPEGHYTIPFGKAAITRAGEDLTIITYGTMVHVVETAVKMAGVDAEIIDLRSLAPIDNDTIINSVNKTGRCLVAHEATKTGGFGAEILSIIQENCFWKLRAPIERVTGWDIPYPHAFEWEYFPGPKRITNAINRIMEA